MTHPNDKVMTQRTEVVDGSNESLYHPDEESDPNLRKGIPLQKNLKIINVICTIPDLDSTTLGQFCAHWVIIELGAKYFRDQFY